MSCVGVASTRPLAGERMLFDESMRMRASAWASADSGRCTAIWSPSKSALNAWHTSGWTWIALPSTSFGSNAWMPRRWSVGARFSSTGCSAITSSRTSQISGVIESTYFFAVLLEHEVLVVVAELRRAEAEQPLEAVVPVDAAAVAVVAVPGGEAAAVELHHRAKLGRGHRDALEDHPLELVLGLDERVSDL